MVVLNLLGPDVLAPQTLPKVVSLGHRVSECIVAGKVWGLGGGRYKN